MQALLLDCDGVIAETERDGHRLAFNRAFAAAGLDLEWSVERYGELLTTAGGRERMRRHFEERGWPVPADRRDAFIDGLHQAKTGLFMEVIRAGTLSLRPGLARLVDEAISADIKLAVCSTSNERAVTGIIESLLGPERYSHIRVLAGDVVQDMKPDPAIYRLAARELEAEPEQCVVIEDSRIGLHAALGAGMPCIVTPSLYTAGEDFTGAARVVPDLGDDPVRIRLADCRALCP